MNAADGAAVRGAPRYLSTRDAGAPAIAFAEALAQGLAPDGGLYVPTFVPHLDPAWREAEGWPDLLEAVLRPYFEGEEADVAVAAARAALDFPVPLRPLTKDRYLLELFHGPTLAFKDIAARAMAHWWARLLRRQGERALVLVATSGDTGAAVADALADLPGLGVAVLYPEGGVSPLQERQLTVARPGAHAFAIRGTFDDCQRLVKQAMADPGLRDLRLSSANSINVGRLLPQLCSYAWGVLQLARARGSWEPAPLVSVPSGNLGNLTAGLLAAAMGLPVAGFVAAHNANDFFPRYLAREREPFAFMPTVPTVANAMDVGAPSNFERLHALFASGFPVPVSGVAVQDAGALAALARTHREDGVLVCPHTAIGLEAVERLRAQGAYAEVSAMVLATAHPAKFPEVVARAVPGSRPSHPALESLSGSPRSVTRLPARLGALARALRSFAADQAPGASR